jgi:Flp pilus assembly protein protease CpaA
MTAVCLVSAEAGERLILIVASLLAIGILTFAYILARTWWERRGA